MVVLLGCILMFTCAVGMLGFARIGKDRRTLKRYERECMSQLSPLPQLHNTNPRSSSSLSVMCASLFTLLLAPAKGVEQSGGDEQDPAAAARSPRTAILEFIRQAALRISGLSLLMANQQEVKVSAVAVSENRKMKESEYVEAPKKRELAPQHTWSEEDDASFDSEDGYDADSFEDAEEDEASLDDSSSFDSEEEQESENGAQAMLFDGLQFYTVLTQVGVSTVRSVVQQAVVNALETMARKRVQEQQNASISVIGQRYPDILCLSAPNYLQHTTRADLATALLAAMQQQQQPCSTMQRSMSIKRPDSLALAAEDGMEPIHRTPLTSPSSSSTTAQIESNYLQAA